MTTREAVEMKVRNFTTEETISAWNDMCECRCWDENLIYGNDDEGYYSDGQWSYDIYDLGVNDDEIVDFLYEEEN